MKILLINEAAGFHNYLKEGLIALGHEVVLAMPSGATHQGRSADYFFGSEGTGVLAKVRRNLLPLWKIRGFKDVDIASFMLGISAFNGKVIRYRDLSFLSRRGVKLSYIGTGCDEVSLLRVRPDASEFACKSCQEHDEMGRSCEKAILSRRVEAASHAALFQYTVSPCFEYDHCRSFFPKAIHKRIPLPVNVGAIEFVPTGARDKPVIVHSPTRRGFKGTHVIIEAVDILKRRYSDFVFKIVENVSHADYLRFMRQSDIFIDQVFMESAGMAALENLAMGKIVLSGNGPGARAYFDFGHESPVVNAPSDPRELAGVLYELLLRRDDFGRLAESGRQFVETYHDHIRVAKQYVDLWEE